MNLENTIKDKLASGEKVFIAELDPPFDVDFESVPPYSADEVSTYPTFCGDSFAEIASFFVF